MSEQIVPDYDPNDFESYDSIADIKDRLNELDPYEDSVLELAHLNREAARLTDDSVALQRLAHTFSKDIATAATYHTNEGRVESFKDGVKHTLIDIAVL